jgi:hypothetical protein
MFDRGEKMQHMKNHRGPGLQGEACCPAVAQDLSRGTRRM